MLAVSFNISQVDFFISFDTFSVSEWRFLSQQVCELFPRFPSLHYTFLYEGWNFNSGNYLFTTDTK